METLTVKLNNIQNNIDHLVDLNKDFNIRSQQLHTENKELKLQNETFSDKLKSLEEENKKIKIVNAVKGTESSTEVKLKINEFVREIDKCIALLNE
ncbi:MAG: hypothetical protein JKY33_03815 [Bacteroidia bacterium]|nr:hypothetical protein [Bacteroidia bacterium]